MMLMQSIFGNFRRDFPHGNTREVIHGALNGSQNVRNVVYRSGYVDWDH